MEYKIDSKMGKLTTVLSDVFLIFLVVAGVNVTSSDYSTIVTMVGIFLAIVDMMFPDKIKYVTDRISCPEESEEC